MDVRFAPGEFYDRTDSCCSRRSHPSTKAPRQDERKARRDLLNRPGRLGPKVLRALRIVVDDDVGVELLQLLSSRQVSS